MPLFGTTVAPMLRYWRQLLALLLLLVLVGAGMYAASNIGASQPDRAESEATPVP